MGEDMIYIGSDSSGYEMKKIIMAHLDATGRKYVDCGSGPENSRYPYFAARVASAVSSGKAKKGILVCGTGVGMSIAANKFKGVRAALITDSHTARITRRHNDSNILCLGGKMLGRWTALNIVDVWLTTEYDGGHHQPSLDMIAEIEDCVFNGQLWCPEEVPYQPFEWNPNQTV